MSERLISRIAALLARPMSMKPQTERQVGDRCTELGLDMKTLLQQAANTLEDYDLEILFGPLFTPSLEDRARVAEVRVPSPLADVDLSRIVQDVARRVPQVCVCLPDGMQAALSVHPVLVERFVRLLHLDRWPGPGVIAGFEAALPEDLQSIAIALVCEPRMTPRHQAWFAALVAHMTDRHPVSRDLLQAAADFIAAQSELQHETLVAAAEAMLRASAGSAAYAASGHAYWSPDVAQHHHYRGQGNVDQARIASTQAELQHATILLEDIRTFNPEARPSL